MQCLAVTHLYTSQTRNSSFVVSRAANHMHERRPLYGEGGDDGVVATAREYEERSHRTQLRQRPTRGEEEDGSAEAEDAEHSEGDDGAHDQGVWVWSDCFKMCCRMCVCSSPTYQPGPDSPFC